MDKKTIAGIEKLRTHAKLFTEGPRGQIEAIADEIEEEVTGMRDFCERVEGAASVGDSLDVFGVEYVAVPVDTDDVPIRVGDEVEVGGWPGIPCIVREVRLQGSQWVLRIVQKEHEEEAGYGEMYLPWPINRADKTVKHIKADTWERIIEDAICGDGRSYGCLDERIEAIAPNLVARCKALAGESE